MHKFNKLIKIGGQGGKLVTPKEKNMAKMKKVTTLTIIFLKKLKIVHKKWFCYDEGGINGHFLTFCQEGVFGC